jgi:tRNA pseudouridine55 synthase
LLPICLGEASKFAQGLLDADKTYTARLCLGVMTATGDAEGAVLERKAVQVSRAQVDAVVVQFTGGIEQIPPMYSALKHQGRPLYELARQGIHIDRAPRQVTIYHLKVLGSSFEDSIDCAAGEAWIDIEAKVSKGTYIRTLGQDIGAALCCGAHLSALRRTAVAGWTIEDASPIEAMQSKDEAALHRGLLAVDAMLGDLSVVHINAAQMALFCNGGRVRVLPLGDTASDISQVRVYFEVRFLGVAALKNGVLHPVRLIGRGE